MIEGKNVRWQSIREIHRGVKNTDVYELIKKKNDFLNFFLINHFLISWKKRTKMYLNFLCSLSQRIFFLFCTIHSIFTFLSVNVHFFLRSLHFMHHAKTAPSIVMQRMYAKALFCFVGTFFKFYPNICVAQYDDISV
jgi:hypothetical protein